MEPHHLFQRSFVSLQRLAWSAVVGVLLLCVALLGNERFVPPLCLRGGDAPVGGGALPVAALVGSANHKTGSKQLVCLGKAVAAAVQTNVTIKIISNTSALDAAEVAAAGAATPGRPALLVTYFHNSHDCHGLSATGHAFRCPRPAFPCGADGTPALSLAGCFFALPTAPLGVLHFVRNPWDVVTSGFWYHQQEPAPEAWIEVEFKRRAGVMMGEGVPAEALRQLGLDMNSSASYGHMLRTLPEESGIQLEFWRSAPGLYAMARQYQFFAGHPGGQQHRYESLQADWDGAVQRIARRFYPGQVDELVAAAKLCDVGSWTPAMLAASNHVTAAKHGADDRARLQRALAVQPEVRQRLCELCTAMEYGCLPWCGDDWPAEPVE